MDTLKNIIYLLALFFFFGQGCKETLVGSSPADSPRENFDQLWQGFDQHYSYFEIKPYSWDSLYHSYFQTIDTISSDKLLFNVLSDLLSKLSDFHVTLRSDTEFYSSPPDPGTLDKILLELKYLNNISRSSDESPFLTADIREDISYLRIDTFRGKEYLFKEIDSILENLYYKKGLILDLRSNGGGSDINSQIVMSRFADKKTLIRKIRYRNGPQHTDFSKPIFDYVEPNGFYYDKPVVLLTDRSVYSAAEDFILGMRQFPDVLVLGERTAGSSGNPATFDLPNGWIYTVPRWQILQPENDSLYENTGLIPDTLVYQTERDDIFLQDAKMDAAVRLLLQ